MTEAGSSCPSLQKILYSSIVRDALLEDMGRAGDRTTDSIVGPEIKSTASIAARKPGTVAGLEVALEAFYILDPAVRVRSQVHDGAAVSEMDILATLEGSARALLSAERTALNFLGHLSGIATSTRSLVSAIAAFPARVVCTRKTTPGLRALEKYAVRAGGGSNHRFGLDDGILIKDNHILAAGSLEEAVRRVRLHAGHMVKVEVEVDTLGQLETALGMSIDAVLLDNMKVKDLAEGVRMAKGKVITEASGGISRTNIAEIAATGVDLISVGWITHSAPSLDVALDFASS
jgi:nicotinate-nucleotide pyrophosphorylase (carboxylating)